MTSPTNTSPPPGLPGIDVSWLQGHVRWGDVRASGVEWAYARMGEAAWLEPDLAFDRNFRDMRAAGIVGGGYHVFHDTADIALAVKLCKLRLHDWRAGVDLPPIIDLEWIEQKPCTAFTIKRCEAFVDALADAFGVAPMLYTNAGYLASLAIGSPLAKLDTILAHYGAAVPTVPHGFAGYWGHQWIGNGGRAPGVDTDCDRDVYRGTRADFDAWLAGTSGKAPDTLRSPEVPRASSPDPAPMATAAQLAAELSEVP